MANVNVAITEIYPQAGSNNAGEKIGRLVEGTKAAQNDTITITNANTIVAVYGLSTDAAGAAETRTFATNVITATSATTGTVSGLVVYK